VPVARREDRPRRVARALTRYRHGPGTFKFEFAVHGGGPWAYEPTRRARHRAFRLLEIAAGEKLLHAWRMPEAPFVLVCPQYLANPSRSDGDVHPVHSYARSGGIHR